MVVRGYDTHASEHTQVVGDPSTIIKVETSLDCEFFPSTGQIATCRLDARPSPVVRRHRDTGTDGRGGWYGAGTPVRSQARRKTGQSSPEGGGEGHQ